MGLPRCLAAFTASGANYPEYVNISLVKDDRVEITVRAPVDDRHIGATTKMSLTTDQFRKLCFDVVDNVRRFDGNGDDI
jgi:hypothetical protein